MVYLLDANVFIQAKNFHYGFDFCPAFWQWLEAAHASGVVFSVEKVGDELLAGADDLATWVKTQGSAFFLTPDEKVVTALSVVSRWVNAAAYEPAAVSSFLQAADLYLVAHALAYGYAVVTHEVAAASTRRVKIPNACTAVGVDCRGPFEMLRNESARFILQA
jgi:predicted nucleic acid-binding protein